MTESEPQKKYFDNNQLMCVFMPIYHPFIQENPPLLGIVVFDVSLLPMQIDVAKRRQYLFFSVLILLIIDILLVIISLKLFNYIKQKRKQILLNKSSD